jgi:hypothetical protein
MIARSATKMRAHLDHFSGTLSPRHRVDARAKGS